VTPWFDLHTAFSQPRPEGRDGTAGASSRTNTLDGIESAAAHVDLTSSVDRVRDVRHRLPLKKRIEVPSPESAIIPEWSGLVTDDARGARYE